MVTILPYFAANTTNLVLFPDSPAAFLAPYRNHSSSQPHRTGLVGPGRPLPS